MPAPGRVANIIKTCLGEVGIAVDVILSEPADHQRALWAGEHDLALHGWFNDNGDPDNFLYTLLDSDNTTGTRPSNIAFYSNAWFHDVIGMAQRTTDPRIDGAHRARTAVLAGAGDPGDRRPVGAAGALEGRVRAARRAPRAGRAAVGDGSLPLGGARAMSRDATTTARAATRATAALTRGTARPAPTGSAAPKRRAAGRRAARAGRAAAAR